MSERPTDEHVMQWHRWFAVECNNAAWALAEQEQRTEDEDRQMLASAYASVFHWSKVGTPENAAHGDLLLGQVHALLGHGQLALQHAERSFAWIMGNARPDWERAFAHAILAHAAARAGRADLHSTHHRHAQAVGETLDPEDRAIFEASFRLIPSPA